MIWTLSKLTNLLIENGVDISKWGNGEAKTVNHLLKELIKEECEIIIREGKVTRIVHALSINVIYRNEVLKEKYQIFKDGRKRRRRMDCSVAEKLHQNEISDLNNAVKRGLKEELQINDISTDQIHEFPQIHRTRDSGSYPDTSMDMVLYKFTVELIDDQYNPEGYIENQEDKDTYFVWVKQDNLKNSGWVNESVDQGAIKGSRDLKATIKISNETKDLVHILTDVNLKIKANYAYQYDIGFYILLEVYKPNRMFKWYRSYEILKMEEYQEFFDRVEEISNQNGYYVHTLNRDSLMLICANKEKLDIHRILNTTSNQSIRSIHGFSEINSNELL